MKVGSHLTYEGAFGVTREVAKLVGLEKYTPHHHAIYVGDGNIVHFSGGHDGNMDPEAARVVLDTLDNFKKAARRRGSRVRVQPRPEADSPQVVLRRCLDMVGQGGYNPITNNCEDLAWYCLTGNARSEQRERIVGDVLGALFGKD